MVELTGGTDGAGDEGPAEALLHVRVEGRVQRVGFRRWVQRVALGLDLGGWARNLADGSVEVAAAGPPLALGELARRLADGPPHAHVERLVPLGRPAHPLRRPFAIRADGSGD